MEKRKITGTSNEARFVKTQANLDKKGKTNKKLKSNPVASKYLTSKGQELKDRAKRGK